MIELIIPGKPLGKQRPRVTKWGTHTPEKTVNYETLVKELYIINKFPMMEGYISMEITAFYEIPKSTSKKKKIDMLNNSILPDKKPDIDNIAKIICDSLNGVAYSDDKQIISLKISKFYSEEPRVVVKLEKYKEEV